MAHCRGTACCALQVSPSKFLPEIQSEPSIYATKPLQVIVSCIEWVRPYTPVQILAAPVAHWIKRHKLPELRVVEPVPQQVKEARVLVPVAELRSHSVVQILADAGIAMGELKPLDKILHKPKSLF